MISPKSLDEIYQNDIISMIIINCDIVCVCVKTGFFFVAWENFSNGLEKTAWNSWEKTLNASYLII